MADDVTGMTQSTSNYLGIYVLLRSSETMTMENWPHDDKI